jgi:hypothetical protein
MRNSLGSSWAIGCLFLLLGAGSVIESFGAEREMIRIVERTPRTDEFYQSVVEGLNFLPPDVKRSFADAGVSVVITPTLARLGETVGKGTEYSPSTHSVIICERQTDGTTSDLRRMPITTLHELGHAFDQMLGYPSRKKDFRAVYAREAASVPEQNRRVLAYFLVTGTGPRECFASLFACKYYRGNDRRLTALKQTFPETFDFVEKLHF